VLPDDQTSPVKRLPLKPALFVDADILRQYGACIRRVLVGLTGAAHSSALVGPAGEDMDAVLCPMAEMIEHPAIKLRFFSRQNKKILLDKLSKFKPTVLHGFWPGQIELLGQMAQELDIPLVAAFLAPCSKNTLEHYDDYVGAVAAVSDPLRDALQRQFPSLKDRIVTVPMGSFVEDTCACFDQPELLTSLILQENLQNAHDFEAFLKAVHHLLVDGFEFVVGIIGQGGQEKALRKKIRELGLDTSITIVPPMRPLRTIFSGADIFVRLCDTRQCSIALLEALSVGLCPAGCADSLTGLLADGKTAALFNPQDETSIYNTLHQLLSAREKARTYAMNAQQMLRQSNRVSTMVESYLDLYTKAQTWYAATSAEDA